jgi:hypothetical protein
MKGRQQVHRPRLQQATDLGSGIGFFDPGYTAESEDAQVLLRPLFITSFMIDDFLCDNDFFGANAVLISSASSKTCCSMVFMLSLRADKRYQVIGLTSVGNCLASIHAAACPSKTAFNNTARQHAISMRPAGPTGWRSAWILRLQPACF